MQMKTILTGFCCFALWCTPVFAQGGALSKGDQAFLKMAAETDMTEAHMGQMAQDQASDQGVKDLGQTLIQDHTKDYQAVSQLATKVGATIPNGIDSAKVMPIRSLSHLKGKSFDHRFIQESISGHEKAIAAYKKESEHGDNADVKAYATQTLPTLEEHLHKSEDLAKQGKKAN
jgi:putative membrane protein